MDTSKSTRQQLTKILLLNDTMETEVQDMDVITQTLVNIKHTPDYIASYVTGLAVLPNGEVLFADDIHRNVVHLDRNFSVQEIF